MAYGDFEGLLGLMAGQGQPEEASYPSPRQAPASVSMGPLLKSNWGLLGTVGILSALASSGRRRPLGQVLGNAGLDALSALGQVGMAKMQRDRLAQQDALQRSQWEAARADRQLSNAIALGNYQLKQAEAAREAAGYQMLGNIMGGGLGGGMPGMGAPSPVSGGVQPGQGLPTVEGGRGHSIAEDFHNPGNIKNPATHNAADRRSQFRRYASDAEGFQDMARLLGTKGYRGLTVRQMANRWVTGNPASSAPAEYLGNFAKMGFNLDAPANVSDPKELGRLLKAFAVGESPLGARYSAEQIQGFLFPGPASPASASPVPAGSPLAPPSAGGQDMSRIPRLGAGIQPLGVDPRLLRMAAYPGKAGETARGLLSQQIQLAQLGLTQANADRTFLYNAQKDERDYARGLQQDARAEAKERREQGKYDAEMGEKAEKRQRQEEQGRTSADGMLEDIAAIRGLVAGSTLPVFGPGGMASRRIPGTNAYNANRLLDSLKGRVAFDSLQRMRAASPTGGALGAVSDAEQEMLKNSVAALDPNMSPDQLERSLQRIEGMYLDVIHGRGNWSRGRDGSVMLRYGQSRQAPSGGAAQHAQAQPRQGGGSQLPPGFKPVN